MLVRDNAFQRSAYDTASHSQSQRPVHRGLRRGDAGNATGSHLFFGLQTPMLLDVVALGLLAYAAALSVVARRQTVDRSTLMAFAIVDGLWVAGSAVALFLFWANFSPVARVLVIAVALAVEAFATLQYRAARTARDLPGSAV